MNKICTSLEQSKKLVELGIDVNTADMCWSLFTVITNGNKEIKQVLLPTTYEEITKQPAPDFIERYSAWSLAALMDLLDDASGLAKEYGLLWYCYDNRKSHCTKHYETQIDAVFEMVCWLKENGKI